MVVLLCHHISNFYPRSPCGERHFQFSPCPLLYGFLSTLSLWRATAKIKTRQRARKFLSTLSLRRATKGEEQDTKGKLFLYSISIHALLTESDLENRAQDLANVAFLSTLSLRRATHAAVLRRGPRHHFYPRSPYGERRSASQFLPKRVTFLSTLSLRRATHRQLYTR